MRIEDVTGRLVLRSEQAVKASGDAYQMIAFAHAILANASHKAAKKGNEEEHALIEEVREDLLVAKEKLGRTSKPNGGPAQ